MKRKPLLENPQSFAQDIVDTVREPLLILDAALCVRSANHAFYQTFRVSPEETEDHHIYELGNGQWDIPPCEHCSRISCPGVANVFYNRLF